MQNAPRIFSNYRVRPTIHATMKHLFRKVIQKGAFRDDSQDVRATSMAAVEASAGVTGRTSNTPYTLLDDWTLLLMEPQDAPATLLLLLPGPQDAPATLLALFLLLLTRQNTPTTLSNAVSAPAGAT